MSPRPRPTRPQRSLSQRVHRRGRPVIMLALVLGGWSLLRAATWDGAVAPDQVLLPIVGAEQAAPAVTDTAPNRAGPAAPAQGPLDPLAPFQPPRLAPPQPLLVPVPEPVPVPVTPVAPVRPGALQASSQRMAVGHAMLAAAGFGSMQLPPELAAYFTARSPGAQPRAAAPAPVIAQPAAPAVALATAHASATPAPAEAPRRASRWSADGWLLWRDDATTPINSGRPTYGRSQAGAVARYRLAQAGGHAAQAYLRVANALQGTREREAALGLSARPLAQVPVRVAAELRASERVGDTELRPAAYAVTELAPQALPLGASAEAYAQAGYVGGRARTAFVDGQLRVDRSLGSTPDFDLRAGGGAWGGAQRGSARLDIGPSASVTFDLGEARGRLAADYRFRVAGDARPASGPALTLSAGF